MENKVKKDGRSIDHHTLQIMRQQAVKAVGEGVAVKVVAQVIGVTQKAVYEWVAAFASGGQKALLAKPIPGAPSKLNAEQMRWIANAVKDNTPQQLKFEFGLWTLSIIKALVEREFNVEISVATARNVMKRLGFTVQKPLYKAWQQDDVLVQQWRTEFYPSIVAEAKAAGAKIYFGDESGLRSDYHAGTTWAPAGETPVATVTGARYSVNMLSAVNKLGEISFMLHDGSVNTEVFIKFLQLLVSDAKGTPVFLIVDGHPMHKTKLVNEYIESTNGLLKLFILPPYSPHLNPDEQVWAHIKRDVAKKFVETKLQMLAHIQDAVARLKNSPSIIAGMFRHPDCDYAA